jgi:hypothetical protein
MSDLYTIYMRQKQVITTYDKRGNPTGATEVFVEVTHSMMPAATVRNYKAAFPDAFVRAEREIPSPTSRHQRSNPKTFARTTPASPTKAPKRKADPMFDTSTYADAINAHIERAA